MKKGARQLMVYLPQSLAGWVDYKGLGDGGMSGYVDRLIEEDRQRAIDEDADEVRKYSAFLIATDRTAELDALKAGEQGDSGEAHQ